MDQMNISVSEWAPGSIPSHKLSRCGNGVVWAIQAFSSSP